MARAEDNKRYFSTENGRKHLKKAQNKYLSKNIENADNFHRPYDENDMKIIDAVIDKKITISEAAIMLGRNNSGIADKIYRRRKDKINS